MKTCTGKTMDYTQSQHKQAQLSPLTHLIWLTMMDDREGMLQQSSVGIRRVNLCCAGCLISIAVFALEGCLGVG
jgi:hypothetical protein